MRSQLKDDVEAKLLVLASIEKEVNEKSEVHVDLKAL